MSNNRRREKRAQLRALECLAYASTMSYLRAQNDYDRQAQSIIENLRPLLHISSHRHHAELKRIINDEDLEHLVSLKHFGQCHMKRKWMELEDETDDRNKDELEPKSNTSTGVKKKGKV
jgi:hypothetical protein